MSILNSNIKKYREKYNWTQDELGELLSVSGKTVSSWEKGRSEPKIDMIEKNFIAQKLSLLVMMILDLLLLPMKH